MQEDNVYYVLAKLRFRIYVTTSYFNFLELALRRAGKVPRTMIVPWNKRLESDISYDRFDRSFKPVEEQPVVYHLNGFIDYPESLVLTEDDYTEQLIEIASNRVNDALDIVPGLIRNLLSGPVIVLGYKQTGLSFKNVKKLFLEETSRGVIVIQSETDQDDPYSHASWESKDSNTYFGTPQQCAYELYVKSGGIL